MPSELRKKTAGALLVGRANVGKSTLFNRLLNRSQAIISPEAGTTRDLNHGLVNWRGRHFWLTDSGGFVTGDQSILQKNVLRFLKKAMNEAAVILHLVDAQTGVTPEDRALAKLVQQTKAHRILVINKADSLAKRLQASDISLGYPETVMVSAQNGSGVGDLLDLVIKKLSEVVVPKPTLKVGFIGQTNVGKSSLYNRLFKEERSLVLPTPHTTRDRLHDFMQIDGSIVELVDTAGVRRQINRASSLEKQSVKQSLDALKRIEVALIVLDSSQAPAWQDQHIARQVVESKLAAVILLNKCDLVTVNQRAEIEKKINRWLPMISWAPKLWVSALTGEGSEKIIELAKQAGYNWRRKLSPEEMNRFFIFLKRNKITNRLPLVGFEQVGDSPPVFKLTLRQKTSPPLAIADWLTSQLRKKFKLTGSPIIVRLETIRQANIR